MKYETTVTYNKKVVTFKVTKVQISGSYTLNEFIKKVRIANNDTIEMLHMKTDYLIEDCEAMENGTKQISKDYIQNFAAIYKLPKKLAKLGQEDNEERKLQLGDRLYQLRIKEEYTQAVIAKMIGVARTTYASYESGQNEPDLKTLIRIANIYRVSIDFLVNRNFEDLE